MPGCSQLRCLGTPGELLRTKIDTWRRPMPGKCAPSQDKIEAITPGKQHFLYIQYEPKTSDIILIDLSAPLLPIIHMRQIRILPATFYSALTPNTETTPSSLTETSCLAPGPHFTDAAATELLKGSDHALELLMYC